MTGEKQIGIDLDVHRAIEQARRSFTETANDILRRLLAMDESTAADRTVGPARTRARGGEWTAMVLAETMPAINMKEAYRALLERLIHRDEGFLARFSEESSRSRRFVARSPEELYPGSPHLAADHARALAPGWYFDTNLSESQVAYRARVAARVANLRYGTEACLLKGGRAL